MNGPLLLKLQVWAAEEIESVKILRYDKLRIRYVSADEAMTKHYEFPGIFIRDTKKGNRWILNIMTIVNFGFLVKQNLITLI